MDKKNKLNFNYKKGWDTIDVTESGYAETSYEYFETIYKIPLLKSKVADVWHIGQVYKGELPSPKKLFYSESEAKKAFSKVKQFKESELASRHRFNGMTASELEMWLVDLGANEYVGKSVYQQDALNELEFRTQIKKFKAMEM